MRRQIDDQFQSPGTSKRSIGADNVDGAQDPDLDLVIGCGDVCPSIGNTRPAGRLGLRVLTQLKIEIDSSVANRSGFG
ncbi:MAG: hypothetical protein ACYDB3_09970, partial [Acidimicrobiales bacterium]